jgi:hypothetical protein
LDQQEAIDMARIELKYCTIRMRDGLKGSAVGPATAPVAGGTTLSIGTVALNSLNPGLVPVGARFNIAGETNQLNHTVTGRTQGSGTGGANEVQSVAVQNATGGTFKMFWGSGQTTELAYNADPTEIAAALAPLVGASGNVVVTGTPGTYTVTFQGTLANAPQSLLTADTSELIGTNPTVAIAETTAGTAPTGGGSTTSITFSPPLGAGTYAANAAIIFKSQEVYVKIGEGNLTYTEHRDYTYLLDRGWLDTVRESKDVPMDVKVDAVYEHITNGTGEAVCPMDALKGVNSAAEWVSSSPDSCEPYCVDVLCEYNPPCAPVNRETNLFPMFRAETREINYNAATIVLTGKCLAKEPTTYRGTDCDNV